MSLAVGSRIGSYQVVSRLGEGGMGVVFRARDTRLERDVAIKTLPDVFASDPDRLSRFRREAQVLASLNHPHIAQIYGFEELAGACCIAMELVEGETLADRLVHGPIAVDDVLQIARQVADALEVAHDKGVVHRDLKPANIKIGADGAVKVLDFGLAKAMGESAAAGSNSLSPTLSLAATQAGVILGTAAYMAPEQAKGKSVDRRADIWAFGVVVHEMLTGRRLFSGETVSETLAQVMMQEPDWQALSGRAPARLIDLLRRCLVKDPRNRLQSIGDARIELFELSRGVVEPRPVAAPSTSRSRMLGWALISATLGASVTAAVFVAWPREAIPSSPISRWTIQLGPGERVAGGNLVGGLGIGRPAIAVSPDDRQIVYVVERNNQTVLHVRALQEFEGKPIPGTEGGFGPFFSPDGQWVGFFTDTKLKKVFLQGGAPVTLADAVHVYGATWASDDRIYYSDREAVKLTRIAAGGGTPEVVATTTTAGAPLRWPHALPGSRALLFNSGSPGVVSVLSLEDGTHRPLIPGTSAAYVGTGHLVFSRGSDVLAAPFDLDRLVVTAPAVPVLQNVRTEALDTGQFSISNRGTLAYVAGGFARHVQLVWRDRQGRETPLNVPSQVYGAFELSPDGRRAVIVVPAQGEGQSNDLWIYDLERDTRTRLTAGAAPIWTHDGSSIIFGVQKDGVTNMHRLTVDGAGPAERLVSSKYSQSAQAVSPDGGTLVYIESDAESDSNLWSVRLDGDRKPLPLLRTPAREIFADFSPDGRWLAYVNDASGRYEVYVMRSDGTGERRQVSTDGGEEPRWSARGDELFYRNGETWMAVSVTQGATFTAGRPQTLFAGPFPNVPGYSYDVSPDGSRFLMAREATTGNPTQIRVVLNWFDELTQRLAATRTP
jgi:serine/threonine protein kinase/Tol biopolymer transport system component